MAKAGYVSVEKVFRDKRPRTTCRITGECLRAFEDYVDALKSYVVK